MATTTTTRRIDAARNDERILTGALAALGEDPNAGMEKIASACGLSRATVFRRYPNREALLEALRERAHDDLRRAVEGSELDRGDPGEALDRLIDALVEASVPYSFLLQNPAAEGGRRPGDWVARRLEDLIERGQRSGDFTDEATPRWWTDVLMAVLMVGMAARRRSKGEAKRLIKATLTGGLRAPG